MNPFTSITAVFLGLFGSSGPSAFAFLSEGWLALMLIEQDRRALEEKR